MVAQIIIENGHEVMLRVHSPNFGKLGFMDISLSEIRKELDIYERDTDDLDTVIEQAIRNEEGPQE